MVEYEQNVGKEHFFQTPYIDTSLQIYVSYSLGYTVLTSLCNNTALKRDYNPTKNIHKVIEILLYHLIEVLLSMLPVYHLQAPSFTPSDQFCSVLEAEINLVSVKAATALIKIPTYIEGEKRFLTCCVSLLMKVFKRTC